MVKPCSLQYVQCVSAALPVLQRDALRGESMAGVEGQPPAADGEAPTDSIAMDVDSSSGKSKYVLQLDSAGKLECCYTASGFVKVAALYIR